MIHLEYDVPKAGTRVSFVLCDGAMSFNPQDIDLHDWMTNTIDMGAGKRGIPQTRENLLVLRAMIDHIIETGDCVDKS